MQGKIALCESDSQYEKAYESLTKSAVAALDCFLELKDVSSLSKESSSSISLNIVEHVLKPHGH